MPESTPGPSPSIFFDSVHAFHRTAALKAGIELDLFTAIDSGATTVPVLAKQCNAAPRGIRILCDYLVIIGWLKKSGEQYALTPESATFVSRKSPQYLGKSIEFLLSSSQLDAFRNLTQTVRHGGVPAETVEGGSVAPENPVWVDFARAMMPMMSFPAELLAQMVAGPLPHNPRVLDIAAGHGLYGLAVARHRPDSLVTALDWKTVLTVAKENAKAAGAESRFKLLPGNALTITFSETYDLVLLTNFLHHFDKDTCKKLLSKVRASLNPGGRVAILEFIPNVDRISPPLPASFSLMMLATTPTGDAYTYPEYEQLLKDSGFSSSELHPLNPTFFQVVIARK